uniref:Cytochrome b561 bacterial/Ni-hydrogenase domain-containing protein n=1 Tax=Helicotheca tamesis TaxID=374047 RepID=A0A7S2HRU9_9STRA
MSVAAYTKAASYSHWVVAAPLIASVGSVLKAQQAPKSEKGLWMHRHKSMGLLTGMLVLPRLGYRLINSRKYDIAHLTGSGPVESIAAKVSHYSLYAFMTIMPATGIAMGYFGGKGLPFFSTSFPGVVHTEETKKGNLAIAKQSFSIHKQLGVYGKYLIPIHVGAAFKHYFSGQAIFARINPFRGGPKF